MAAHVSCSECKQKMVNSVLEHSSTCSANAFTSHTGYGTMPPAQVIKFDTIEEQEAFNENLKKMHSGTNSYVKDKN